MRPSRYHSSNRFSPISPSAARRVIQARRRRGASAWTQYCQAPARPKSAPEAPTCTDLWPGAAYFERECFDLLGVRFTGHAHLKRLLMPEGYDHHPLRKDFPHQGIQPDRLYREWDRERRAAYAENERDGEATR